MDNLFGTPPSGASQDNTPANAGNPPTPDPTTDQTLSILNDLKGSLEAFTTRLDDMDVRINEVKTPVNPVPQPEPQTWKPKTWDEIPEKAGQVAAQVVDEKLEEQRAAEEERIRVEQEQKTTIDTYLDKQVSEMETAGALPKITNKNDPNDPGIAARHEVFGLAARLGTMDLVKAEEVLDIMHKNGYAYDPRANGLQGAYTKIGQSGMNAPVAVPGRTSGTSTPSSPNAEAIHKAKNFDSLRSMAGME